MSDLLNAIERLIRAIVGDTRYYKQYPSTVQGQNGMTLDLVPDDAEIAGPGGLQGVPLRVGLPGFEVKVPSGARVLLGYDNGNPAKPYASLFDPGSVTSIHFAEGTQAVARQGDLVVGGGVGTVVCFSNLSGLPQGAPPNNALQAGVPYLISFGPLPPTLLLAEPLYSSIASGRQEFQS